MNDIIPFGKYKGQPVDAIAEDRGYLDWLTAQSWFRDKYPQIYTLVINNFQEPTDTPEHNRLHVKFLDNAFCLDVCRQVREFIDPVIQIKTFESGGYDVLITLSYTWCPGDYECDMSQHTCASTRVPLCTTGHDLLLHVTSFKEHIEGCIQCSANSNKESYECGDASFGRQLVCSCGCHRGNSHSYCGRCKGACRAECHAGDDVTDTWKVGIEIKPTVSDDFPSILRALKRLDSDYCFSKVLCLHEYTGSGATKDQFVAFMETGGVRVIWI